MNIDQMLQQTNAVGAISRELGIDPATAQAGATALLPSIVKQSNSALIKKGLESALSPSVDLSTGV